MGAMSLFVVIVFTIIGEWIPAIFFLILVLGKLTPAWKLQNVESHSTSRNFRTVAEVNSLLLQSH